MRHQKLITIHGISTAGEWQEMVEHVLGSQFSYSAIKYGHYRHLGAVKLLVSPVFTLLAVGCLTLAAMSGPRVGLTSTEFWVPMGILVIVSGHLLARKLRARTLNFIDGKFVTEREFRPPHLIAHSLGTYLAGSLLSRSDSLRFDRIVLTGSVLSPKYNWAQLNACGRFGCGQVRNEVGKKDLVVWGAFFLHGWNGAFGRSGFSGFHQCEAVHNLSGAFEKCPRCEAGAGGQALVHNVPHTEVGHSDLFITPAYCDTFWLPFLVGLHPQEYRDFGDLCLTAAELEVEDFHGELPSVIAQLNETSWAWCRGTLKDHLRKRLQHFSGGQLADAQLEKGTLIAVQHVWRFFYAARLLQCQRLKLWIDTREKTRKNWWGEFLKYLSMDESTMGEDIFSKSKHVQDKLLCNLNPLRLVDAAVIKALKRAADSNGFASSKPAK